MRIILLFVLCLLLLQQATAQDPAYPMPGIPQNIVQAEYFFDVDPGFGAGTAISITPGVTLTNVLATINTSGLASGIHRFGMRTRNADGGWSLTNAAEFLVNFDPAYATPVTVQTITRAEYFIDADPGFGNGTTIAFTPAVDVANVVAAINTTGLPIGIHRVYLRTQNAEGGWSITAQKEFLVDENPAYPMPPVAPGPLVYAEYFFDTDPGFGAGTPIAFTPSVDLANVTISVSTVGLADGVHQFYLRTLDDWSLTGYQSFLKGAPLPLRLLSFNAKNTDRTVALSWQTEAEANTSHFEVERSADGRRFEKIGAVTAANVPGRQGYAFSDAQPLDAKAFYRLKQVDKDGRYAYSATLLVNRSKAMELQLFPNPAQTMIRITMPQQGQPQQLILLNATAQVLKTITVAAGAGSLELALSDLAPGQYFLKWQGGANVLVKGFVKQ